MPIRLRLFVAAITALMLTTGWSLYREVSIGESMSAAGKAYIDTLDGKQRRSGHWKYDDERRVGWHFVPKDKRKGVEIKQMTPEQREARTSCCVPRSPKRATTR
ncbi:MAG: DUF3500 domain-containing protein [Planctomycetaceae bacterium]